MKKYFYSSCLVFCLLIGAFARVRAQGATPNEVLRSQSIFAEAENFTLPTGWAAVNGHGIDMYSPPVSNNRTINNPVEGSATLNVTVPKDGQYTMFVWFTKWVHDRSFELRVEQNGKIAASSDFNRPQDKFKNWSYNFQKGEVVADLKAGPAKLILYAPPFKGFVGSPIDCVLLTSASDYLKPDWHDFSPQTFVRFTVLSPQAPAVTAASYTRLHHDPWSKTGPVLAGKDGQPVPPGQPSAWTDMSKVLDSGVADASAYFIFKSATPLPPLWKLRFEIASEPNEKSIIKTFEEEPDGNGVTYILPGDLTRYPNLIDSAKEITQRHVAFANSIDLPGGKGDFRPKYLTIEGQANVWSPRLNADENEVLAKLGINAVSYDNLKKINGYDVTMDLSKSWVQFFIHDNGMTACSFDPVLQAKLEKYLTDWVAGIKKNDPEEFRALRLVKLADEPGTPNGLTHIIKHELDWEPFRTWLKARGCTPQGFGFTSWEQVKPIAPDAKATEQLRRLGWLSSLFAQETAPLPYKRATEILQKAFGRPIETRVNFTDAHLNGFASTMSNGNNFNWFEFGRMQATTMPWTEDWMYQNPQLTSFLADLLRSTKATPSTPLGMYIIWGYIPPLSPHSAELRTMTAVARGIKTIDHYLYGPHYTATECAFSDDENYVKSVAYVDRVLGLSDDVLGRALPPPAQVAVLWSQSTEIWKIDDAFTTERRVLNYALSMQQVPMDFIDENGLLDHLDQYRVLFLPANNMPAKCVSAIEAWVKAGGTLIVCGGGPDHDDINNPSQALLPTMGLQSVEMRKDVITYRGDTALIGKKPTTSVTLTGTSTVIPVAGYKAVLTPLADTKVLGTYTDGGVAIVEHRGGLGKVLTFGFNPGMSVLLAMDPAKLEKTEFWNVFPTDEMKLISDPIFAAGVQRPVSTQIGIDAARLDGPDGTAVTLANYTLLPIQKLRVMVRCGSVGKVVSAVRGNLKFEYTQGGIILELPLDSVDVIKIYK